MTQRILAQRGSLISEQNSLWWTLGAMWMRESTETLTAPQREALAEALALLLERPDPAASRPEGLGR